MARKATDTIQKETAENTAQEQQEITPTPKTKTKFTFMLHDCKTMEAIGKLVSVDYRYGALKACSRINKLPESCKGEEEGTVKIWLRRTNTKIIREYVGRVVTLDSPQTVVRQNREIVYTKRPHVKYVKQWVWEESSGEESTQSVPAL